MKKYLSILLCLVMILTTACTSLIIPIADAYTIEYGQEEFRYRDIRRLEERITQLTNRMDVAHEMAEAARALGFNESHSIIATAKEEYINTKRARDNYQGVHDELVSRWQNKVNEYPTAAYVWRYFQDAGYNDEVIAGIVGNMMVEVGGYTLNLDHQAQTSSYYGLCQWSKGYSEIWGASLEEQCSFLLSTIKYELDTYGYMYKKGYNYESFLLITDIQQAALMFSKSYERGPVNSNKQRQQCAVEAYNYFVT